MILPDHPQIAHALRSGYPHYSDELDLPKGRELPYGAAARRTKKDALPDLHHRGERTQEGGKKWRDH